MTSEKQTNKRLISCAAIAIGMLLMPGAAAHASQGSIAESVDAATEGDYTLCTFNIPFLGCVMPASGRMIVVVAYESLQEWICGPPGHTSGDSSSAATTFDGVVITVGNTEVWLHGTATWATVGSGPGGTTVFSGEAVFTVGGMQYIGTASLGFTRHIEANSNVYLEDQTVTFGLDGASLVGGSFSYSGETDSGSYASGFFSTGCDLS